MIAFDYHAQFNRNIYYILVYIPTCAFLILLGYSLVLYYQAQHYLFTRGCDHLIGRCRNNSNPSLPNRPYLCLFLPFICFNMVFVTFIEPYRYSYVLLWYVFMIFLCLINILLFGCFIALLPSRAPILPAFSPCSRGPCGYISYFLHW
jgi:hypothetical protein